MYSFFYSRQIILQRVGIHQQHFSAQKVHVLIRNGDTLQLLFYIGREALLILGSVMVGKILLPLEKVVCAT